MDVPAPRDEGRTPSALAPIEGAAPIAIIDFLANAEAVVQRLAEHTCVPDWVLARRLGEEWVVLAGHGQHGFRPGDELDRPEGASAHLAALAAVWTEDVVVDLTDDHVEPRRGGPTSADTPARLDGLVAFPLWGGDGLFGAVCALPGDPEEEHQLRQTEPMVRLTVELLTSVLGLDLDRSRLQRRLDAAESAALSDPMTGLGNRRAFERAVDREEARCARFGHRAGVMVLDLDGLKEMNDSWGHSAGDDMIRRAGETIRTTLRSADQAFRIGGDEFALLLPEMTADGLSGLCERLADALAGAGVAASIGSAIREPAGNLHASVRAADAEMYEQKRARTGGRIRTGGHIRR
jgi:diguanylate cyclase (GGDEF)-like protein